MRIGRDGVGRDITGDPKLRRRLMRNSCKEPHNYIMDYAKQFIRAYNHTIPKFTLLWLSFIAHEAHSGLYHSDDYFSQFFDEHYEQLKVRQFL